MIRGWKYRERVTEKVRSINFKGYCSTGYRTWGADQFRINILLTELHINIFLINTPTTAFYQHENNTQIQSKHPKLNYILIKSSFTNNWSNVCTMGEGIVK